MNANAWLFLLQRLTAVGLVIALGIHFWMLHFANPGPIIYDDVNSRLAGLSYFVLDLVLLAFALFHGLNGLISVLKDSDRFKGMQTTFSWIIVLVGIFAFIYGTYALFMITLA